MDATTNVITNLAAPAEPMYLHLSITDPEVAAAIGEAGEGRERQEFALTALRVGILSLRAARGTVDGATVRHEGDRLVSAMREQLAGFRASVDQTLSGTLRQYFDPASGLFAERVQRLVRHDGDLANVVGQQVEAARRAFDGLFDQHLGEQSELQRLLSADHDNAFPQALREQVNGALRQQGDTITAEFTLDRPESALSRLVRELEQRHGNLERALGEKVGSVVAEFSLDDEHSALSRLKRGVETVQQEIGAQFSLDNPESGLTRIVQQLDRFEQQQREQAQAFEVKVTGLLQALVTRREQARRSNAHGAEFEARVGETLRECCVPADDVIEECGSTTGLVSRCKIGDFVITLGPDTAAPGARIVVEAKAREVFTLKQTLAEADEARRNRDASVCLFVHAARTAPAGLPDLHRHGHDVVVVWDEDDPLTDVRLKAGYLVARALAIRAAAREEEGASLAEMDAAIEAIRQQLAGFEEIGTSAQTVIRGGEKIAGRAAGMRVKLEAQLTLLQRVSQQLKGDVAAR